MSQRRSRAVFRRAAARRSIKTVATRQAGKLPRLYGAPFPDEDGMDLGLGEKPDLDPPWQSADVLENVVEALVTEETSRLELYGRASGWTRARDSPWRISARRCSSVGSECARSRPTPWRSCDIRLAVAGCAAFSNTERLDAVGAVPTPSPLDYKEACASHAG
jgi:hypothetical protein